MACWDDRGDLAEKTRLVAGSVRNNTDKSAPLSLSALGLLSLTQTFPGDEATCRVLLSWYVPF